jgi:hypothetical protein
MPPPACVKCRRFFHVRKNSVDVMEGMPTSNAHTEWTDYKLWEADLWECEGCGAQIIVGYGQVPIAEHYQSDFARLKALYPPLCRIDDCPGPFNPERAAQLRGLDREGA